MIDIHTHILYGLDDGAEDEETTFKMLQIAESEGIESVILTPHYIAGHIENNRITVHERCEALKKSIKEKNINIDLYPGNEVFIDPNIIGMFEQNIVCSLNDSKYILFELPMVGIPRYLKNIIYEARIKDFIPILAHPERNRELSKNPSLVEEIVDRGALVQVNAGSLRGLYGRRICEASKCILKKGLVDFIASDAHTCEGRAPRLKDCRDLVTEIMGEEVSDILFEYNPNAVLNNKKTKTYGAKEEKRKRIFAFNSVLSRIKDR